MIRFIRGIVVASLGLLLGAGHALATESNCPVEKALTVGVESSATPPFTFGTTRKVGIDIDVISALRASCADIKITVQQAPFEQLFDRLRAGQFDLVVSAITINAPAKQRDGIVYSIPYYEDAGLVLAYQRNAGFAKEMRESGDSWQSILEKRKNKKVPVYVKQGTTSQHFAKANAAYWRPQPSKIQDVESLFKKAGESTERLVLFDAPMVRHLICGGGAQSPEEARKLAKKWAIVAERGPDGCDAPLLLTVEQYGVALRADDVDRLRWVNLALHKLLTDPQYSQKITGASDWEHSVKMWSGMSDTALKTCANQNTKGPAPRCFKDAEDIDTAKNGFVTPKTKPWYRTTWESMQLSGNIDWGWSDTDNRTSKVGLEFDIWQPKYILFGQSLRSIGFTLLHATVDSTHVSKDGADPDDNRVVNSVYAGPRGEICIIYDDCKAKLSMAIKPLGKQWIRAFSGAKSITEAYELSAGLELGISEGWSLAITWKRSDAYPINSVTDHAALQIEAGVKLIATPSKLF